MSTTPAVAGTRSCSTGDDNDNGRTRKDSWGCDRARSSEVTEETSRRREYRERRTSTTCDSGEERSRRVRRIP